MAHYHAAPPELSLWCSQMRNLVRACAISSPAEQSDRIREACLLFRKPPKDIGVSLSGLPGERALEAMLAANAQESAALALLGTKTGFMLSRGNGTCLASVVLPGSSEEHTATGCTVALALVLATATALLAPIALDDSTPQLGPDAESGINSDFKVRSQPAKRLQ